MVAKTDLTVLITGESGTGKELAARAIHSLSPRKNSSFVPVNCPTLPEQILESELFGYKKGAFTDATQNKIGLFQEAHGGTLFLDEIGDIGPAVQAKLLRVLQEKEIKPLGDTRSVSVDVRILASTNQDLKDKIQKGLFREDLFYRLNVLPLKLPSLGERRSDIPLIANHFLEKHCAKLGKPLKTISPDLMTLLSNRRWEGNIREMENIVIRGILFSRSEEIQPRDAGIEEDAKDSSSPLERHFSSLYRDAKEETLKAFNAGYIGRLLSQNDGNVTQAAQMCGLERQALQQIMRRYGIESKPYRK
jgi:DNA-binding NtrC family response regulator